MLLSKRCARAQNACRLMQTLPCRCTFGPQDLQESAATSCIHLLLTLRTKTVVAAISLKYSIIFPSCPLFTVRVDHNPESMNDDHNAESQLTGTERSAAEGKSLVVVVMADGAV